MKEFDSYLRNNSRELYNEVERLGKAYNYNRIKLLCVFRRTHFMGYTLVHRGLAQKFLAKL